MIRLIVSADDLGSGPARDRGVFQAFTAGIVTSASLLANGTNFAAAAGEALACGLPVGVHLNLSEGNPLSGPIAGLTGAAGAFPGKPALRAVLKDGTFNRMGVRRELLAQIDRVRQAGLVPDHLDTHQHCLLFPALTGLIADIAVETGIRALRLPLPAEMAGVWAGAADCVACPGHETPVVKVSSAVDSGTDPPCMGVHSPQAGASPAISPSLASDLDLYRQLAPAAHQLLQAKKLWTPDGLWGMPLLNRLNEATLADILATIPAGTWELMTHPGYRASGDPFGGPPREAELAALTAPVIRRLIEARGIELTTFGACACAC